MAAPATRRNPRLVVQTLARCLMHPAVRTLPAVRPFSAATANPTAKDYLKDYEFPKAWPFQSEHFRWSSCMPCIWQIRVAPANVLLACVARRHKTPSLSPSPRQRSPAQLTPSCLWLAAAWTSPTTPHSMTNLGILCAHSLTMCLWTASSPLGGQTGPSHR